MAATKQLSIRLAATGGEQVRREFGKLGKDGQRAFHHITHATTPANAGLKAVDASARALHGVLRQAAGLIGAYAGIQGLSRALGFIVSTNREFERLHASLKTVTGSAHGADTAFKMIEDFASSTPFNVEQITEAFIQLKALGLDPSEEALRSYGNTASAMGKHLMQFVEAIADAATGEFERLKEFGIKARTQGEQIAFTFQGVTTTVGKNAAEIERYLRQIGNVQFAGAMAEQMNTLSGIFSNIQDNFSKLAREVGAGGLNDAIRDVAMGLKETTESGQHAARALGETLGGMVRVAAHGLGLLVRHADRVVEGLTALLIARTVGGAMTAMNAALLGNAGTIVGFRLMAQVSVATAAKMVITEGAAKLATLAMVGLRKVMLVLGGPAGIAIIAGLALYKLAQGHDAAGKAAKDHAAEMEELRQTVQKTTDNIEELKAASRNEALARWTEKLHIAQDNIREVTKQLKYGAIGGFWDQFSRVGSDLQAELLQVRRAFQAGTLSVEHYQDALWALAVKYPDFTENAKEMQEQVLALQAAALAAKRAQDQLDRLRSGVTETAAGHIKPSTPDTPSRLGSKEEKKIRSYIQELEAEEAALKRVIEARSGESTAVQKARILNAQEQALRRLGLEVTNKQSASTAEYEQRIRRLITRKYELQEADDRAQATAERHEKTVETITRALHALKSETEQATLKAMAWREETLAGLDKTRAGYDAFRVQVEAVYQNMLAKARAKDLQSAKHWEDGLKQGFRDVAHEAEDMAAQAEKRVKKAFKGMEDALAKFVTTGKLDFQSFADSIIADLVRIHIRQSITGPLAYALGSLHGGAFFGTAHTGGVIGGDELASRHVEPAVFAGAHTFHRGGVIGHEVPIIARRGETVFTPGQMRLLGTGPSGRAPVKVEVHVRNHAPGVQARTETSSLPGGGSRLDIMIEQIEGRMTRNVARGEGLAPTLERRYGLNPAAGSYR